MAVLLVTMGLLLLAAAARPVREQELVVNGSFETPAVVSPSGGMNPGAFFGGWHQTPGEVDLLRIWGAALGSQFLDLNGFVPGGVYQDLATEPGRRYKVSFYLAGNIAEPGIKTLGVSWGGVSQGTFSFDSRGRTVGALGWERKEFLVTATAATTRLQFTSGTPVPPASGPLLDGVSVTPDDEEDEPLAAPTNLRVTPASSTRLDLAWDDNSDGEDGFEVERQIDGGSFTFLTRVTATTYSDPVQLEPDRTYKYRVRAYKADQHSGYSNEEGGALSVQVAADQTVLNPHLPLQGPMSGPRHLPQGRVTPQIAGVPGGVCTIIINASFGGKPVRGYGATLAVEPELASGGHDKPHGTAERPTGTLSAASVSTDAQGVGTAVFTAGVISGTEYVTVLSGEQNKLASIPITIGVSGLVPIPPTWVLTPLETVVLYPKEYFFGGDSDRHHSIESRYHGRPEAVAQLQRIARHFVLEQYRRGMSPLRPVLVNDFSLMTGGLHDFEGTWAPPHARHRDGTGVDLRMKDFNKNQVDLLRDVILAQGGYIFDEAPGTARWHWHLTLLGYIDDPNALIPESSADLNRDGRTDQLDLEIIGVCKGAMRGDDRYSPLADVNKDGVVNGRDTQWVARRMGRPGN